VARRRNPVRLILALSVAAVLAVFLIITAFASGSTPQVQPSELAEHDGTVNLGGTVVGPVSGDARGDGLRFELKDVKGSESIPVVYVGSVPDLFRPGREIMLKGQVEGDTFVAERDSLVTKCPSKYAPSES
jgi:cytochrome c-type biogenesis protein CcmE